MNIQFTFKLSVNVIMKLRRVYRVIHLSARRARFVNDSLGGRGKRLIRRA